MFHVGWHWVLIGIVIGSLIGAPMAIWMPMTAVPQRTALSHAFGALAAALVGIAHYYEPHGGTIDRFTMGILALEVLLGSLTFTGSLVAFGKLQELIPSSIKGLPHQNIINFSLLGAALLVRRLADLQSRRTTFVFVLLMLLGLAFGLCLVMPIGGADMPTVISLLNSYAGLSASLMGFVLDNYLLIIAGALDGSSGLILSIIMCKAMNRSFTNVLFGRMDASTGGVGRRCVRRQGEVGLGRGRRHAARRRAAAWSSCPATAWPWPRPSTRCASCSTCWKSAAPKSSSRFIPSPAACRGT